MDDIDLLKRLSQVFIQVSGQNIEAIGKSNDEQSSMHTVFSEDIHMEKTHELENKSNIGLIAIDQIEYFLYNTQHSFEKMKCFSMGVGTVLGKLSRAYGIPVIVTGEVDGPKNYSKYTLSPWLNFPTDTIFLDRVIARETSQMAPNRQVVKPLTVSKHAPFYISRIEGSTKEYKLKYTVKVLSISDTAKSEGIVAFTTERTFKNS